MMSVKATSLTCLWPLLLVCTELAASTPQFPVAPPEPSVQLTQAEAEALGVRTLPATRAEYAPEAAGFATVLDHRSIARACAAAVEAEAAAFFRRSAGTQRPGDCSTTTAATASLSAVWGTHPPWRNNLYDPAVRSLARGTTRLVKAEFPLSTLHAMPRELRAGPFGSQRIDAAIILRPVWEAHADKEVGGFSLYAMVSGDLVADGDFIQVWAPISPPIPGIFVPATARVVSDGRFWFYVEVRPNAFQRLPLDATQPVTGGYIVNDGLKPNDRIVVSAATQLLARELRSGE